MQQALLAIASACTDVAIRIWMKDKESYIVNSVLDISKLAKKLGCDCFSERHMSRNLNDYISDFAEKLYTSNIINGIEDDRKEEIILQLQNDILSLKLSNEELVEAFLKDDDIGEQIKKQSISERKYWSEKEQGVYNNLVRYASDAIESFVAELPAFTIESAKVLFQHNSAELEAIQKKLDNILKIITASGGIAVDYRNYEVDYVRKVYRENQKIEIFGSGLGRSTKRYDISTSYIELSCIEQEYEDNHLEMSSILERHTVFWITGEAGSGKTTFVQWLATHGIENEGSCINGLVPIFIKLRNCSFPFDLEAQIRKGFGENYPTGWIDYLIKYDKLLLLFDGLDEIATYERDEIYNFIEDTLENIKAKSKKTIKSKIIITTRPYVDDILEIEHGNYQILRMNTKNIEKFIRYWHQTVIEDKEEGAEKASALLCNIKGSPSLKNIAGTPLLCAMICALNYVSNESIPTNRNELYEKCCRMLIEDRDKERRIDAFNDDLNKLDYTKKYILLSEISLHMLMLEKAEIEKDNIVSYIGDYIDNSTIITSGSVKENPTLIVDYLVQRTGILREPTRGEIDYIHKSFLEYLGACAIVRNEKWELIKSNVINPFWKEAIIMCFNEMNIVVATSILERILEEYEVNQNEEFLFMASLCAQNSAEISGEISELINNKIESLIPPTNKDIDRLVSAGLYIIPFLKNKDSYDIEQKTNCLKLLERLLQGDQNIEAINVLLSYINNRVVPNIVNRIAHILISYTEEILTEYEVPENVYEGICNSIVDGTCETSWDALYLSSIHESQDLTMQKINKLIIHNRCQCFDEYIEEMGSDIFLSMTNVDDIEIDNIWCPEMMTCIERMKNINKISLHVTDDRKMLLEYLKIIAVNKNIQELIYDSKDLKYICDRDLEAFPNLEKLKLVITDPKIEFEITNWSYFRHLKYVEIVLAEIVYWEIEDIIDNWENNYPFIQFDIYSVSNDENDWDCDYDEYNEYE